MVASAPTSPALNDPTAMTGPNSSSRDALNEFDVLCGRDKRAFNHQGNRRFRVTVSLHQERYASSNSRKDKSIIIKSVITMVARNGGRFLRSNKGVLEALSEKETHEKVAHAFRDMVLSTKKTSKSSSVRAQLKRKQQNKQSHQQALPKDQLRSFLNRSLDPVAPSKPAPPVDFMTTDPLPLSDLVLLSAKDFHPASNVASTTVQRHQNQVDPLDIFEEVTVSDIARVLDLQMNPSSSLEEELPYGSEQDNNYNVTDSLDDAMLHWLVGESDNLYYRQHQQQRRLSLINSLTMNHNNDPWPV